MREWELLSYVYRSNPSLGGGGRVTIPPGDDMGAITVGGSAASGASGGGGVLVTVDQVADGVHVDLATTPIDKIGRKAITRNLSDVAAMAARPIGAVAAASLPRDLGEARATQLFDAMRATAESFDCPLFGGDVSMWDGPLLLTVTILAEPDGIEPVLRRGARVGDAIYVTGQLGGSLETVAGYTHHLDFEPRLDAARQLAGNPATRPHCMIDLSDGLAGDLRHLCDAGNVSARLFADKLPLSPGAHQAAQRSGEPPWRHAVGDGEDYELLFTAAPDAMPPQVAGVPITAIGVITAATDDRPQVALHLPDGGRIDLADLGWEHRA